MTGMRRCVDCGTEVRTGRFVREVTGWERPRDGGGANAIVLRRETGKVLCVPCLDLRRLRGQGTMI